jgi:hypothetical protein
MWGASFHSFKTTKENLTSQLESIELADLSQNYVDAILATRELEIQYLWIDALCIVQGDKDEWHSEGLKMGDIYQNAVCTIAAHTDRPDHGFLLFAKCESTRERDDALLELLETKERPSKRRDLRKGDAGPGQKGKRWEDRMILPYRTDIPARSIATERASSSTTS